MWIAITVVYRPLLADIYERRARLAEGRAEWRATALAAQRSLGHDPFRLRMRYLLGSALARWDEPGAQEEAVRVLLTLQELAPDYANLPTNLGTLLLHQGRVAEAIPLLERAVEMNPYDELARQKLQRARQLIGLPTAVVPGSS
jgi:Flp pilus assembly protein TadD